MFKLFFYYIVKALFTWLIQFARRYYFNVASEVKLKRETERERKRGRDREGEGRGGRKRGNE